jgi:acid phosphatase type 7
VTRGPYLQIGTSTGVTIRWRTDQPSNSRVRWGTSPTSLTASTQDLTLTTEHVVNVTGAEPATKYYYSVGTVTQALAGGSSTHSFTTSPPAGTAKQTRVWVVGDGGTADADAASVQQAFRTWNGTRHVDVWLMLGDNAYDTGTDSEYQAAIFEMYTPFLPNTVLWPTRGNHDDIHSGSNNDYYDIFSMPTSGQAGGLASGTEAYYSYDYGNVHFICLDSEGSSLSATGAMANWLRSDIEATSRDWVIAYWHHPPYSKGSHDSDSESQLIDMRENFVPILESAGVDLVLTGHSHSYERSVLLDRHYGYSSSLTSAMKLDPGNGRESGTGAYRKAGLGTNPHEGAVYTVAGASGSTGGGSLDHPIMVTSLDVLGSMIIDVDGQRLDARYLDNNGSIRDSFTILKGGADVIAPAAVRDLSSP